VKEGRNTRRVLYIYSPIMISTCIWQVGKWLSNPWHMLCSHGGFYIESIVHVFVLLHTVFVYCLTFFVTDLGNLILWALFFFFCQLLQEAGPERTEVASWTVIGQFSSIGSLGSTPDQWLCTEWLSSLAQCRGATESVLAANKLQLVNLHIVNFKRNECLCQSVMRVKGVYYC
jgi:hypothetical protein